MAERDSSADEAIAADGQSAELAGEHSAEDEGFIPRSMHWPLWAGAALLAAATIGSVTLIPRFLPA